MAVFIAGLWGLAGGLTAGLLGWSAAVTAAGFHWPSHGNDDGIWPRLFVTLTGIAVGTLVAAAAHSQMTGPWPAFLMGVGGPAAIRGTLTRTEVAEVKPRQSGDQEGGDHAA